MKLWRPSAKDADTSATADPTAASRKRLARKEAGPERTRVNALATRAAVAGVYGLMALGAIGGGVGIASAMNSSDAPVVQQTYVATTAAEGAAVTYMTSWLQATQSNQDLVKAVTGEGLPVAPFDPVRFSNVAVAGAERTERDDVVSVTVSALLETTPAPEKTDEKKTGKDQQEQPAEVDPKDRSFEVRYWQVAVQQTPAGGLQVIGTPTPVPAPARSNQELTLGYGQRLDPTAGLGRTTTDFLQSYAAGKGDAGRYVAPGSPVRGITPAPYEQINVIEIRSDKALDQVPAGEPVHVLVQAEAELPFSEGDRQAITIALTMQERDDRWEVVAVDPAPLITSPDAS